MGRKEIIKRIKAKAKSKKSGEDYYDHLEKVTSVKFTPDHKLTKKQLRKRREAERTALHVTVEVILMTTEKFEECPKHWEIVDGPYKPGGATYEWCTVYQGQRHIQEFIDWINADKKRSGLVERSVQGHGNVPYKPSRLSLINRTQDKTGRFDKLLKQYKSEPNPNKNKLETDDDEPKKNKRRTKKQRMEEAVSKGVKDKLKKSSRVTYNYPSDIVTSDQKKAYRRKMRKERKFNS